MLKHSVGLRAVQGHTSHDGQVRNRDDEYHATPRGLATLATACSNPVNAPDGAAVEVAIAPLKLSGVANACYRLTVTNAAAQTVWREVGICADQRRPGPPTSGRIS